MRYALRTLLLILTASTLISCAHGTPQTPPRISEPDIAIPSAYLVEPSELPTRTGDDRAAILSNHVAVASAYGDLADRFAGLVCALLSQSGFTVNGSKPAPPSWCGDIPEPQARHPPTP